MLSAFAALGGFLFGYDTGVISGALLSVGDDFDLSDNMKEAVVSSTVAAAIFGATLGSPINEYLGRRGAILVADAVFTVGAVLMAVAPSVAVIIVGRGVVGLGVGLASMTVPPYIAEMAPPELRGSLVTTNNLFICIGQLTASIVCAVFSSVDGGWRYMLGLAGLPSLVQFVAFLALPESPRWLVEHGNSDAARKVLMQLRGHQTEAVEEELGAMNNGSKGSKSLLEALAEPSFVRALRLGCALQACQQLIGINTVMYYSATILRMGGFASTTGAIWGAVLVSLANAVSTMGGVYAVDRFGRRPLTLGSLVAVAIALSLMALSFGIAEGFGAFQPVVTTASLIAYLIGFSPGMGPMPWTINAEIYETPYRSHGTAIATAVNWVSNMVVAMTFLDLCRVASPAGAFLLYAVVALCSVAFFQRYLPETKDKALEDMVKLFSTDDGYEQVFNESS